MLLQEYILDRESDTDVIRVPIWKESEMGMNGDWREWLDWINGPGVSSVLIVDEAQSSYWDRSFWLDTIKQITYSTPFRIITFASYGTNGSNPALASPFFAEPSQIIGLHSADGKTQLCLSKEEFSDFVNTVFRDHRFDSALLDSIYDLTDGHVGACHDVLEVILGDEVSGSRNAHFPMNLIPQSYRKYPGCYTTERFNAHFDMKTLLSGLTTKKIFSRGLPKQDTLRKPEINALFKEFLKTENPIELDSASSIPGLESCVKRGWIYEEPSDINESNQYMLASPLHRRYLVNLLFPSKTELRDGGIFERWYVWCRQLASPKRVTSEPLFNQSLKLNYSMTSMPLVANMGTFVWCHFPSSVWKKVKLTSSFTANNGASSSSSMVTVLLRTWAASLKGSMENG